MDTDKAAAAVSVKPDALNGVFGATNRARPGAYQVFLKSFPTLRNALGITPAFLFPGATRQNKRAQHQQAQDTAPEAM
jgi:hypothetical protein